MYRIHGSLRENNPANFYEISQNTQNEYTVNGLHAHKFTIVGSPVEDERELVLASIGSKVVGSVLMAEKHKMESLFIHSIQLQKVS